MSLGLADGCTDCKPLIRYFLPFGEGEGRGRGAHFCLQSIITELTLTNWTLVLKDPDNLKRLESRAIFCQMGTCPWECLTYLLIDSWGGTWVCSKPCRRPPLQLHERYHSQSHVLSLYYSDVASPCDMSQRTKVHRTRLMKVMSSFRHMYNVVA